MSKLKPCKQCGREISPDAKSCPNCGAPSTAQALEDFGKGLSGCGCLLILLGGGILFLLFL